MRRFRVSYLRTAYMAIDIAAETADEAWARLETLAACEPLAWGSRTGTSRRRGPTLRRFRPSRHWTSRWSARRNSFIR